MTLDCFYSRIMITCQQATKRRVWRENFIPLTEIAYAHLAPSAGFSRASLFVQKH